jgi:hypothetical protein
MQSDGLPANNDGIQLSFKQVIDVVFIPEKR